MKIICGLFLSLFSFFYSHAQIKTLPELQEINGVEKTVMNPKLYPLLLKVHVGHTTSTEDFKKLVTNLHHFEVYTADEAVAADSLVGNIKDYKSAFGFNEVQKNIYEKETADQKEFLVVKEKADESAVVYVFTTTKDFTGIEAMELL